MFRGCRRGLKKLHARKIRPLPVCPLGPEMTVFAHYANFSLSVALITQLLGCIDGEKQGLGLGPVRTIFLVVELDQPIAVVLNDKIPGLSHRNLLLSR
jgi:hypothetical protein